MIDEPRYVEEADTQHNDLRGTCAFDDPMFKTMEELFGLPADIYWVLGFQIVGGEDQPDHGATVFAVETSAVPNFETLQAMAAANDGDIPVVEIETRITTEQVLRGLKRVSITAFSDGAVNQPGWRLRIERTLGLAGEEEGE
jgi:hypothetical protein